MPSLFLIFQNLSFISPGSACSLFEIVLKLFNREQLGTGKVVVLDEAHKVRQGIYRQVPTTDNKPIHLNSFDI